jgi:hypothetical protein
MGIMSRTRVFATRHVRRSAREMPSEREDDPPEGSRILLPSASRSRRRAGIRIAVACATVCLAWPVLYLVGINAFLSTGLFDVVINADPRVIDIHYERGWSFMPGHIHAKNLSIRGRDGNVEWILRIDAVEFDVSFLALVRQRFEVSSVHGRGISFRLRSRINGWEVTPDKVAGLPPIAGFGPIPVRPFQHCAPEDLSDAAYHLWSVSLQGVVAEDVREVWLDHGRFVGSAAAAGGFRLKPIRDVQVGPVHVDVVRGAVSVRDESWVEALAGTADVTVAHFDPRTTDGEALAHHESLDIDMHGALPDVGRVVRPLPKGAKASGTVDVKRFELHVSNGVAREGSRVEASTATASLTVGEDRVTGLFVLDAAIASGADGRPRLAFHLEGTEMNLARGGGPIGKARSVVVAGDSAELDCVRPMTDLRGAIDLSDADVPDAAALSLYLRAPSVVVQGGHLHGDAHLEGSMADRRASARASVRADGVRVEVSRLHLLGSAAAEASVQSFPWDTLAFEGPRIEVHSNVALRDGNLSVTADLAGSARASRWEQKDGDLVLPEVRVAASHVRGNLHGQSAPRGDDLVIERVSLEARASRWDTAHPIVGDVDARFSVENADLADMRALQPLLGRQSALVFESGSARGSADVRVSSKGGIGGSLRVAMDHAGGRLRETHVEGDVTLVGRVAAPSAAQGSFDVSGSTLSATHVQVTGASVGATDWQGEAALRQASIRLEPTPQLKGDLTLDASDTSALVGILMGKDLPGFLAGMLATPHLTGSGRLSVVPDRISVRDIDLQGGDLSVRGFFASGDKQSKAALVVKKGDVSAGFDVTESGVGVRLFDLDNWLRHEANVAAPLLRE